jgi:putative ABC transport system ATP-binding protein
MNEVIRIQNLTKIFSRGDELIYALKQVSLGVNAGEFVAITGPSGSGKSTLLYILGLLDKQTEGSYKLEGTETSLLDDDSRSEVRNQKFGFIFQTFHLLPRMSALKNVLLPFSYAANKDSADRAHEMLNLVGLKNRMHHLPNQLSGGQRQRVAIARALVNNPRILFADEPTGNLDSKTGYEIMELFQKLNHTGVTVLLVTHDSEIAQFAKRQLRVRDGQIEGNHNAGI